MRKCLIFKVTNLNPINIPQNSSSIRYWMQWLLSFREMSMLRVYSWYWSLCGLCRLLCSSSEGIPHRRINQVIIMLTQQLQPVIITVLPERVCVCVCDGVSFGRQQGSEDYHSSLRLRPSLAPWISFYLQGNRGFKLLSDRTTTPTVTHSIYQHCTASYCLLWYWLEDFKTDREGSRSDKAEKSAGTLLYGKCCYQSRQYETTWMRFSTLTVSALDINKCYRRLVFIQEAQKDMEAQRAYISDTSWRWMIIQKHCRKKSKLRLAPAKEAQMLFFLSL